MKIIQFVAIETSIPSDISDVKLSTDQNCLYNMCLSISNGVVSADMARKSPGKMSHARWLTTANRILRLYVCTKIPTESLKTLATFVMKVYTPSWFTIKCHSSFKDWTRNLWKMISSSRYLAVELKAVIDPVIQRNAYFAHPENLLLSMLTDDKESIRELGCRRVMKACCLQSSGLRTFVIPKINFDCISYLELIDWQSPNLILTSPPLLIATKTEDLVKIAKEGNVSMFDFPMFPCHTQSVERCVKLTTEASGSVAGHKAREGYICARQHSRNVMPKFNSKQDFK